MKQQQNTDMASVHSHIDQHKTQSMETLIEFLRIPSISSLQEHAADMARAADFVVQQLRESQMEHVKLIHNGTLPMVYADWLHAPGKPTILLYGHYDVQPVDPIEEWTTPPFEPTERDNKLYARGATDDKGQLFAMMEAVKSIMDVQGSLPVNVRFLIEGEEEFGGVAIEKYVKEHHDEIPCDAVLIADTHMLGMGMPSIVYGVRGILYTEIIAHGADHDLHSGTYGGVAPNPLHSLALILAGLKGVDGQISIPGLEELAYPVTKEERGWWKRYPMSDEQRLQYETGISVFPGEQKYSLTERMTARATLEVHGFIGGFQQEGAKTVIPADARVKVSLRLVPGQTPENVLPLLEKRVQELTPAGVSVEVRYLHGGQGMVVDVHNPFIEAASKALSDEYQHETYYLREGGSIPIAALFSSHLHVPIVFAGYGLPDERLHAPDEHFNIPNFYHAIHGTVRYLENVALLSH